MAVVVVRAVVRVANMIVAEVLYQSVYLAVSFITSFNTKQTLKYGTLGDGDGSDIGWVVMVVAVMVDY